MHDHGKSDDLVVPAKPPNNTPVGVAEVVEGRGSPSRGGSDAMPAWFLNLMSSPSTTVQVGSERRAVVARQATPEEKQRLWPRLVEMYDEYAVYQQRTKREIPVVILSPAS